MPLRRGRSRMEMTLYAQSVGIVALKAQVILMLGGSGVVDEKKIARRWRIARFACGSLGTMFGLKECPRTPRSRLG